MVWRIDTATAIATRPVAVGPGAPGYWTKGDTTTSPPVPPTDLDQDWFQQVDDEFDAIVVGCGIAPAKGVNNQIWTGLVGFFAPILAPIFRGLVTCLGSLNVAGDTKLTTLETSSSVSVGAALTVGGQTSLGQLFTSGNVGIGGSVQVQGGVTTNGPLVVADTTQSGSYVSAGAPVAGQAALIFGNAPPGYSNYLWSIGSAGTPLAWVDAAGNLVAQRNLTVLGAADFTAGSARAATVAESDRSTSVATTAWVGNAWTTVSTGSNGQSSGYTISPDGGIEMWGYVSNAGGPQQVGVAFPIPFPSVIQNAQATSVNNTNQANGASVFNMGLGGMAVSLNGAYSFSWSARGR